MKPVGNLVTERSQRHTIIDMLDALAATGGAAPSDATPLAAGTAAAGSSLQYARGDHVHPLQTDVAVPAGAVGTGSVARTVVDKLGDTINVKDFGAVADGVTNDGPAFQLAIDAAAALAGAVVAYHGVVEVPPGQYRIATTIDVESRVRLVGYGARLIGPITGAERITGATAVPASSDVTGQTAGGCLSNALTSETIRRPGV